MLIKDLITLLKHLHTHFFYGFNNHKFVTNEVFVFTCGNNASFNLTYDHWKISFQVNVRQGKQGCRPAVTFCAFYLPDKLFNRRQNFLNICVRSGDNVCSDDFAEFSSGCATSLNCSINSTNVTSYHNAYETGTDFFCSN